ncbi:MAG: hypothetical protein LUD47_01670 [Clostridia bacterium]|nr:hypothetical protein [Clostridia bacterium]
MIVPLCMRCGEREATHKIEQIVNGRYVKLYLCDECFVEMGGEIKNFMPFSDVFGMSSAPRETRCPTCGTAYSSYLKTGLLGCPDCYETFRAQLEGQIKKTQGALYHVGKDKPSDEERELAGEISELQERIQEAIKKENYPEAQRLQKILSVLKTRQRAGGGS